MKIKGLSIRDFGGMMFVYFERGRNRVNLINTIMLSYLTFHTFNLGETLATIFLVILLAGSVLFGYADFRWGIWKAQLKYATGKANPFFGELRRDMDILRKDAEEIKVILKEIQNDKA